MNWGGREAERGHREARKEAAEDTRHKMAGAQKGSSCHGGEKDELEM